MANTEHKEHGIDGPMAGYYDVFVDWPGRLGRELPGLTHTLRAAGAARVLDAGCGTGRHVGALLEAGFDAYGADVSDDMLTKAREHVGEPERFFAWRMGEAPGADLRAAAPFDAITCLGNVWPSLHDDATLDRALAGLRGLLAPGGLLLVGLKAVAIRRAPKNPYLPLLKRERDGEPLFFVRFVDFDVPRDADGLDLCDFHMTILRGDARSDEREAVLHRASRWRVWSPETLSRRFADAGFDVQVSASLGDANVAPTSEDVFVHATAPR